jgi:hypothetical protein
MRATTGASGRLPTHRHVNIAGASFQALTERGPGFVTASVVDPFGNVLGIMYNRHYLDILGDRGGAQ